MTYREKLQKEHPECVGSGFKGGCKMCPCSYGYEMDNSQCPCKEPGYDPFKNPGSGCTRCWDRVISGTEEQKYENFTRDELITIVKLYELKDACNEILRKDDQQTLAKKYEEVKTLNDKNKELEEKIKKLESACSAKNAEIVRLEKELRKSEATCNSYRMMAHSKFGTLNPCNCSGCEEKNKEIERLTKELDDQRHYTGSLINEVTKKNKKILDLDKSLETAKSYADYWMGVAKEYSSKNFQLSRDVSKLEDELKEEKKEHAKHHGIFRIFYE